MDKKPEQRILDYLKQNGKTSATKLSSKTRLNYYHLWIILERLRIENKIEIISLGSHNYIKLKK